MSPNLRPCSKLLLLGALLFLFLEFGLFGPLLLLFLLACCVPVSLFTAPPLQNKQIRPFL